jgi:hypothetical protein
MKAKARPEWNAMPGYTRAERIQGTEPTPEAAFDSLEIGIDRHTLREFLEEPTIAIGRKIALAMSDFQGDMTKMEVWLKAKHNDDLLQLVLRLAPVLVCAERERVEKEEAK